jgi:putative ABC transport system permease protein
VTRSNEGIDVDYFTDWLDWEGKSPDMIVQFSYLVTEYDFTKTHKIRILEGRDFSPEFPGDSNAVLVNQTALRFLDFKDPIGKKIQSLGYHRNLTIIGVMEDVVRASPMDPVGPLYACLTPKGEDRDNYITVRLGGKHTLKESMEKIGPIFKKYDPDVAFDYMVVRDRFLGSKFKSIELSARLAKLFTLLAIFLTGLGILGLAAYMTEQRTKELAIRKVLGARVNQLVLLMSGYFVRIALTALFITIPFTWWAGDQYLENYSYRTSIPLWIAPATALVILVMTLCIVGLRVIRAALANPVAALGRET